MRLRRPVRTDGKGGTGTGTGNVPSSGGTVNAHLVEAVARQRFPFQFVDRPEGEREWTPDKLDLTMEQCWCSPRELRLMRRCVLDPCSRGAPPCLPMDGEDQEALWSLARTPAAAAQALGVQQWMAAARLCATEAFNLVAAELFPRVRRRSGAEEEEGEEEENGGAPHGNDSVPGDPGPAGAPGRSGWPRATTLCAMADLDELRARVRTLTDERGLQHVPSAAHSRSDLGLWRNTVLHHYRALANFIGAPAERDTWSNHWVRWRYEVAAAFHGGLLARAHLVLWAWGAAEQQQQRPDMTTVTNWLCPLTTSERVLRRWCAAAPRLRRWDLWYSAWKLLQSQRSAAPGIGSGEAAVLLQWLPVYPWYRWGSEYPLGFPQSQPREAHVLRTQRLEAQYSRMLQWCERALRPASRGRTPPLTFERALFEWRRAQGLEPATLSRRDPLYRRLCWELLQRYGKAGASRQWCFTIDATVA